MIVKTARCFLCLALCSALGCSTQVRHERGSTILKRLGLVDEERFETGKRQVRVAENMTNEEEYYLGRAVAASLLARFPAVRSPKLESYIAEVGAAAVALSGRPETFGGYHFAILDSDQPNAFSAPGGFVFITRGSLLRVADEEELVAILAHEIGHVTKRHGLAAVRPEHFGDFMMVGELALSALDCGGCSTQLSAAFTGAVGDVVEMLLVAGYSRDQETEADLLALENIERLGYDPEGMVRAFGAIKQSSKDGGWLSSHPGVDDRTVSVRRAISGKTANSDPKLRQARFQAALAELKAQS